MSEPVKMDPIFGTMFGDHASDCHCDDCEAFQRKCRAQIAELEELRASNDAAMRAAGWERCESCATWCDDRDLNEDGECCECATLLEEGER